MNNQQIKTESQLKNTAKISQLQSFNLEQLNDVAGGYGLNLNSPQIKNYNISGRD